MHNAGRRKTRGQKPVAGRRLAYAGDGRAFAGLSLGGRLPRIRRFLPLWLCAPILTATAYAHYTLVHESIHGNLVPGHPRLRWLNDIVGWVGALGLTHNWPAMLRGHALHHAHTNTDQDPDIHVKGTFVQLLAKWLVFVPISLVPQSLLKFIAPAQYRKLERMLRPGEMLQGTAVSLAVLALLVLSIATGRFLDWLSCFSSPRASRP